ncbi:disulfide isomerase-like protein 5-4 [Tanacetum coccineum]
MCIVKGSDGGRERVEKEQWGEFGLTFLGNFYEGILFMSFVLGYYLLEQLLMRFTHDEKVDETYGPRICLFIFNVILINSCMSIAHPIVVVNFYAPWCHWSTKLKPAWEKTAKVMRQRHHVQGYPSIRIYRKGSDVKDTDSLVMKMDNLVSSIRGDSTMKSSSRIAENAKVRPAPPQQGCRIEGFVWVKKVPGNLVISAVSGSHSFDASQMNMSHVISTFSFGSSITPMMMSDMKRLVPYLGVGHNRLNGQAYITNPEDRANVTIEHYLQVVKTEVLGLSHQLIEDYEYTAHTSLIHSHSIPAAKFHLQFSPMQVLITETAKPFSHFITNLCAIIGGVFTVAGILDSILYNTCKLAQKVELGKNF